ncbi:Rieske 2Fe-2S domain-containing protein [Salicibibacter cibarius]|uniref:Rieske 2Fe-2S domain-containing protein n=1 Tax=Salicibibacter cibarius TaxID=2743000 RepID=UPI001FE9FFE0|nr:Rieske 2Fe-2S domain-containing protein [Salicibibacter cibarius]
MLLKKEDNQLLTETNEDKPLGEVFRQYWIPALTSPEIEADGKPKRVKLLGEDLVAFRDSNGDVGLVDEACPHRGTSLYFGINDGCGLRCMYHGWKFDTEGNCVELPSEEETSNFKNSIKLKSYPTYEINNIIWTYMGPEEKQPPFPDFYWMHLPQENLMIERAWQECNYLQVIENDLDFVHAAFLHKAHGQQSVEEGALSTDLGIDPDHPLVKNPPVKQHVENTNYGKRCIAVGVGNEEENAFMEIHYIFPFYTYPPRFEGEDGMWHAFIPRDDHSTWAWDVQFSHDKPINKEVQHERRGLELDEDFKKLRNMDNEYEQEYQLKKDANMTGIRGIANQDHAATETMGTIVDRSNEHLGTSDKPVIQMRKILMRQVKEHMNGNELLKHDNQTLKDLYSGGLYDDKHKGWEEALPLNPKYKIK